MYYNYDKNIQGVDVKKLLALMLSVFIMVGMVSTLASADVVKGQKIFQKKMKKAMSMKGAEFSAQHSQEEWKALFADDAAKFITEYSAKYPKLKKFLDSAKFKTKYMQHIKDFAVEYANDSGNVPSC